MRSRRLSCHPLPDPGRRYDASAHLTEETRSASKSGPRGIIMTVVVSFVVGWMYLLSLTFSIQVGAGGWEGTTAAAVPSCATSSSCQVSRPTLPSPSPCRASPPAGPC